jgi:hypothetical protein
VELRHLRYFVAVAEQKGFREASRFLHMSQPAISKTLTQLEHELGTKLFARSGLRNFCNDCFCTRRAGRIIHDDISSFSSEANCDRSTNPT